MVPEATPGLEAPAGNSSVISCTPIASPLIQAGLAALKASGVSFVFVLGYPDYYTRYGFHPATPHQLIAPHPIPAEYADAWMVQELQAGALDANEGRIQCSDILNKPQYWGP